MEFKQQRVSPGFAERSSKMYILPTLTYLEVGERGARALITFYKTSESKPAAAAAVKSPASCSRACVRGYRECQGLHP